MKSLQNLFRMIVVVGCLLLTVSLAYAIPGTINYQGVLTDSAGVPINGVTPITFRLFDAVSGGMQVWFEVQTPTVSGGVYSVQLGEITPLTVITFKRDYWLEVEVDGETLTPRQPLTSVPYAFAVAESGLPTGGLNEISSGLLSNQFTDTTASTATPISILDNNPTGVTDSITFPDYGAAESITINLNLTNSDLSTITVTLTDPDTVEYTLFNGATGGSALNTSYPYPTATISGNLNSWIGHNPQGTWILKVVDGGYLDNTTDGQIVAWSISTQYISTQTVAVSADLDIAGTVSGDGSGLTSLDWGNLTNLPAGFSDNVDDVVTSVNNLTGGQITSNVSIGGSVNSVRQLNVYGSTTETYAGYFDANYTGSDHSYGLYGRSDDAGAGYHHGVYGYGANSTTVNYGVYGQGYNGSTARGVYGTAAGGTSTNTGVHGYVYSSTASTNYGVYGSAGYGTTNNYGVYGTASGTGAYAGYFNGNVNVQSDLRVDDELGVGTDPVSGRRLNVSGGTSDSYTAYFENNDTAGNAYGLYANAHGATDQSVASYHHGVYATASGARSNYGLRSYSEGSGATTNYGLYARATSATNNYAIYASAGVSTANYAGFFYGNVHVTGTLTENSDLRLKKNILPVENALDMVEAINGVYFNFKDSPDKTMVGVIAQEVQVVLPEAVSVTDSETGYLGVSYTSLVPVLIEALKELKAQNEALKDRVEALEGRIE